MWTVLKNKKIVDLKKFDAIYVGGGNTFKLLKMLKESNFDKSLSQYIEQGGVVYGGSAGALVFGKDIIATNDKNNVKLKNTLALNKVKGYSIWPHYRNEQDSLILERAKKYDLKILAIPERAGVFVKGSKLIPQGYESIYVFEKGKKNRLK